MASALPDADATRDRVDEDKEKKEEEEENKELFECNICLDAAHDAVLSFCGHLFCWPCLHQWLETRPNRQICPVCKAAISKDKVIPVYGRNNTSRKDPREKPVPPRPRAQREEASEGMAGNIFGNGQRFQMGNGFHMSFGIGTFPFGFFATNFNFGNNEGLDQTQIDEEQYLHKVFLWIAFMFFFWLLLA